MTNERPYADLADAIERAQLLAETDAPDQARTFEHIRQVFTVRLGTWEGMVHGLLEQLTTDAGSVGRGLSLLRVPTYHQIDAWTRSIDAGMVASVRWLAVQTADMMPDVRLRAVRIRRGDDYTDLADAARRFRLRGDGQLSPAQLRPRYSIRLRRGWLQMIGDLLGQVVADAGSYERAAVVLDAREDRLLWWVRWLVSRGSMQAARADWPLGSLDQIDAIQPYADLAALWLRTTTVIDDPWLDRAPGVADFYNVELGDWDDMIGELLERITADAGSMRKAALAINLPRSTLAARLKRYRER